MNRPNLIPKITLLYWILTIGFFSECKNPIDENQISQDFYEQSVILAKKSNQKILIVFGADWCGDCQSLKDRFQNNPEIGKILREKYLTIHIDVGRFDKNILFAERFGNPEKKGIPALVIIDPRNSEKILAVTKGGEFSSARSMSDSAIAEYLLKF
jgi:thioredoxin 1